MLQGLRVSLRDPDLPKSNPRSTAERTTDPSRSTPIPEPTHSPVPGGKAENNPDVAFVKRAEVQPDAGAIHGAFQHVAIFKNILVAADGCKSAKLRVFDVRDWSEKQVIRVGAVSEATTGDSSGAGGPAPAAVTSLVFDGVTIACGTAEGHAHTWRLAEHEGKRGYVRLLHPLRVDSQPVTRLSLASEANLLTAYSPTKRTLVVWSLETGKLHAAYSVDGVAKGTPLRFTAHVESVIACVHAFGDGDDPNGGKGALAALLDVKTGEGGAVKGAREVTEGEGEPRCLTFDGELLCVGTSGGAVIAWNVGEAYAPWKGYHGGEVGCVANVPGDAARIVSGGADGGIILWDGEGKAQARMEVGSPVTAIHAPSPRLALAGTEDGAVHVVALCDGETGADEALTAELRGGKRRSNELARYSFKFDAKGASAGCESFEAFTRTFRIEEGAYTAPPAEKEDTKKSRADEARDKKVAEAMMKGVGETEEEQKKREDEEEAAKHRAMDGAGVARDPNIKSSTEGLRRCSNPRCVEREDTIVGKMLRCSRCKAAFYCSSHCQRTHWRDGHRESCKPSGVAAPELTEKAAKDALAPPSPAPQRRQLVIEDDSEDESSEEEDDEEKKEEEVVEEENEPTARDEKEAEPELEKDESPFDETEEPLVVRPGLPPMDEIFADLDLDPDELAQLNNMNDMNDMDDESLDDFDDFDVIRTGDERTRAMDDELFEDLDDDDIDIDEEDMEEFQKAMDMPALPPWMTTHRPGARRSDRTGGVEESSASASIRQPVRMKTVGSGGAADAPELPPWMTTHKPGSDPSPALQKEEAPEAAEDSDDDPLYDLD